MNKEQSNQNKELGSRESPEWKLPTFIFQNITIRNNAPSLIEAYIIQHKLGTIYWTQSEIKDFFNSEKQMYGHLGLA